jgi:putative hydrolases of HD superfamily
MIEKNLEHQKIVEFIKELDLLKNATRTARTTNGRQESVAEHSWRLAMFALVLRPEVDNLDINKIIQMCLIHDLGEAYEGDIPATEMEDQEQKLVREEKAVLMLLGPLKKQTQSELLSLWWEYNNGETEEAKFVKALDKMETIIQHNQGKNPSDFNYNFNLEYGRKLAQNHSVLKSIRGIIDEETRSKTFENSSSTVSPRIATK